VKQIFALEPDHFAARDMAFPLNLGDRTLLFLDGDGHRADRRIMTPPLHGDHLEGLVTDVAARRGVPLHELCGRGRTQSVAWARHEVWWHERRQSQDPAVPVDGLALP
jgi:hypothetical protein